MYILHVYIYRDENHNLVTWYTTHLNLHYISLDTISCHIYIYYILHITLHMRCRRNLLFAAMIVGNLVSPLPFCRVWQSKVLVRCFCETLRFAWFSGHFAWSLQDWCFPEFCQPKSLHKNAFSSASLHLQWHHKLRPQYPAETHG